MRYIYLLFLALLTNCSSTGGNYSSLPNPKLEKGMAQLIIYHPSGEFTGSIASNPDVKINGEVACGLPNGAFFSKSIKPGSVSISSTKTFSIGTSHLDLNVQSNKKYYIRITWNDGKVLSTVGFGLIGGAVAEGVSSHSGPFVIENVTEETAKGELPNLSQSLCGA